MSTSRELFVSSEGYESTHHGSKAESERKHKAAERSITICNSIHTENIVKIKFSQIDFNVRLRLTFHKIAGFIIHLSLFNSFKNFFFVPDSIFGVQFYDDVI
jgi:hypothetical protein